MVELVPLLEMTSLGDVCGVLASQVPNTFMIIPYVFMIIPNAFMIILDAFMIIPGSL